MTSFGLGLALALSPTSALGAAYWLEARTEAQAYQLRAYRGEGPTATQLLPRRRLVQSLGLDVFELLPGAPLGFETSLRVFADLGLPSGEAARIDGARSEEAELLYASAVWRGPRLEVRVGRQPYVDVMDYLALDGARVSYVFANGLGAEAYAGLWVKGSSLAASSVWQPDGTRETDARRLAGLVPGADPNLSALEPLYGAKLLARDVAGFSASLGYRRALLAGKTDLERAALEVRYGRGAWLNVLAGVEADLVLPRVSQARVQARAAFAPWAVTLEAVRLTPVLSADSIFLYFAQAPRDEASARLDFSPEGALRFHARVLADSRGLVLNSTSPTAQALAGATPLPSLGFGGTLGAALNPGPIRGALELTGKQSFAGRQLWLDATAGRSSRDDKVSVDARLSVAALDDAQSPLLRGVFFGAQLWGAFRLSPGARVSVVVEENLSLAYRADTRVLLLFDLEAAL